MYVDTYMSKIKYLNICPNFQNCARCLKDLKDKQAQV